MLFRSLPLDFARRSPSSPPPYFSLIFLSFLFHFSLVHSIQPLFWIQFRAPFTYYAIDTRPVPPAVASGHAHQASLSYARSPAPPFFFHLTTPTAPRLRSYASYLEFSICTISPIARFLAVVVVAPSAETGLTATIIPEYIYLSTLTTLIS